MRSLSRRVQLLLQGVRFDRCFSYGSQLLCPEARWRAFVLNSPAFPERIANGLFRDFSARPNLS